MTEYPIDNRSPLWEIGTKEYTVEQPVQFLSGELLSNPHFLREHKRKNKEPKKNKEQYMLARSQLASVIGSRD